MWTTNQWLCHVRTMLCYMLEYLCNNHVIYDFQQLFSELYFKSFSRTMYGFLRLSNPYRGTGVLLFEISRRKSDRAQNDKSSIPFTYEDFNQKWSRNNSIQLLQPDVTTINEISRDYVTHRIRNLRSKR